MAMVMAQPTTASLGEVDQTTIVCNGADGETGQAGAGLLTANDTQTGTACEAYGNGGTRMRSGLDNGDGDGTANDGVLDAGEVDNTTIVCNGADGSAGVNGDDGAALLSTSDDQVGAGCDAFGNGGTRIQTGLDNGDGGGTANDGVLDAGEVDTTIVCNGANGDDANACTLTDNEDGTTTLSCPDGSETVLGGGQNPVRVLAIESYHLDKNGDGIINFDDNAWTRKLMSMAISLLRP